jgi:hypothetical protein
MKQKFRLYRRGNSGRYYIHDDATGKQTSLHTSDRATALRLLHAKNEAVLQPAMNLQIAQVYLQHGDPAMSRRTWQHVMEQMIFNQDRQHARALGICRQRQGVRFDPQSQIDSNIIRAFFGSFEKRLGFNQCLFAPRSQFRDGDALAAVAGVAKTPLAARAI